MPRHPLPPHLQERLRQRVLGRREREGLTQEALAEQAGCRVQTISRIETGHMQPSLGMLVKLADALQCTVGELVDDVPRPDGDADTQRLVMLWNGARRDQQQVVLDLLETLTR